jgi:predicted transcriptional regulator
MGVKKRCKDEIIYRILKACKGRGIKITKITGSSNAGFEILPKYINLLVENDLIEVVKMEAVLYKTTKKGIEALWHFEQLREMIPGYVSSR